MTLSPNPHAPCTDRNRPQTSCSPRLSRPPTSAKTDSSYNEAGEVVYVQEFGVKRRCLQSLFLLSATGRFLKNYIFLRLKGTTRQTNKQTDKHPTTPYAPLPRTRHPLPLPASCGRCMQVGSMLSIIALILTILYHVAVYRLPRSAAHKLHKLHQRRRQVAHCLRLWRIA